MAWNFKLKLDFNCIWRTYYFLCWIIYTSDCFWTTKSFVSQGNNKTKFRPVVLLLTPLVLCVVLQEDRTTSKMDIAYAASLSLLLDIVTATLDFAPLDFDMYRPTNANPQVAYRLKLIRDTLKYTHVRIVRLGTPPPWCLGVFTCLQNTRQRFLRYFPLFLNSHCEMLLCHFSAISVVDNFPK